MHDDQIRERYAQWAQPLATSRPPALTVVRRRARRRTAIRTAFSVAAVAAAGTAAAIVWSVLPPAGRAAPVPPAAATAGAPPFAVLLAPGGQQAEVVNMNTGQNVGAVPAPAHSQLLWAAAASDDRTFVLVSQSRDEMTRFYGLHLAPGGQPRRLSELTVPTLHKSQVYGLALTADATKLAVAWQQDPIGPESSHISVTTLATGKTRTWTSATGAAGSLSWASDRTIAFDWQDASEDIRSGERLLDTTAPGADLLATRLVIPVSTRFRGLAEPGDPFITQDGSTMLVTMGAGDSTALVSFSPASGKPEAVLTPRVSPGMSYCGILWASPDGRHLVVQCGTSQASITGGRYTPIHPHRLIPAAQIGYANTFAW